MRRRLLSCAVLLSSVVASCSGDGGGTGATTSNASTRPAEAAPARPNVVFIVADDQRADQLAHMPTLQRELVRKGIRFTSAYVTDPLCCPSRMSILRGQMDHSTGMYDIDGLYGGWKRATTLGLENSTLATWLDAAGYHTALVGKYLNGYNDTSYVPPGWDYWRAKQGGSYYKYYVSENGTSKYYGTSASAYDADVMSRYADSFIRTAPSTRPLFLYLNYYGPHNPHTPAPRHVDDVRCQGETNTDAAAFDEDTSDKPAYTSSLPPMTAAQQALIGTTNWRSACEALLSVDQGVSTVLKALAATGRMSNTLIVYIADNGLMYGEHRHTAKGVPYEESIHVPLIVRFDPMTGGGASTDGTKVLNIDLAPTVLDLLDLDVSPACPSPPWGGVCNPGFDGKTLMPLIDPSSTATFARNDFLIEHYAKPGSGAPTYCALRSQRYMYARYYDGAEELYDLQTDPHQLTNMLHGKVHAAVAALRKSLLTRLRALCSPTPPGYRF